MRLVLLAALSLPLLRGQYYPPSAGAGAITTAPPLTGNGALASPIACPTCNTGSSPGYVGSGLISGGGVVWKGNLDFTVSAAQYAIAGTIYTSPQTDVTLSAADSSLDRIDVIAVDNTGSVVTVPGTPAASPSAPLVAPTQIELQLVTVPAAQTAPANTATTVLYDDNAGSPGEWAATNSGAGFNPASTNNPFHGTVDVEATGVTTNNYVQLQKGSGTIDLSSQNILTFYVRSKATWGSNRSLTIYFANGGAQKGVALTFREGSFGFSSSNTSSYQQIVIPISLFQTAAQSINQLVFKVAGSGGTLGFYLDYLQLQSAASQVSAPSTADILSAATVSGGTKSSYKTEYQAITAGNSVDILPLTNGSGYVDHIFAVADKYNVQVNVFVDGESSPSISALITDLCGDHYADSQPGFVTKWLISTRFNSAAHPSCGFYLPIPFSRSVKVQAKNTEASASTSIASMVSVRTGIANTWPYTRRLRMAIGSAAGVAANGVTTMADLSSLNPGRIVGIGWIYDGFPGTANPRSAPLEGNFKFYIDGSGTAVLESSGSEDLFDMAYYFANFTAGTSVSEQSILTIKTADTYGAIRLFLTDPLYFSNAFKTTWQCGDTAEVSFTGTCSVFWTIWYYTE